MIYHHCIAMLHVILLFAAAALPELRIEATDGGSALLVRNAHASQALTAYLVELVDYPSSTFAFSRDELAQGGEPLRAGQQRRIAIPNMTVGAAPDYMKMRAALFADGSAAGDDVKVAQLRARRKLLLATIREMLARPASLRAMLDAIPAPSGKLNRAAPEVVDQASRRALIAEALTLPSVEALRAREPALASTFDQAAIQQYCFGCHNSKLQSGGLALESGFAHAAEKIVRRLRARQMPPAGLPRPSEETYGGWIASLENTLDREAAANPNPGRTDTFRRLNRTEYQNAIRDLLAVDVDVAPLLPSDDASHGFDNVTVGNLSPALLERYLNAAQKISRFAVGAAPKAPGGDTLTLPPDLTQEEHFEGMPLGTRGGAAMRHFFPADAQYDFQLRLARDRNEQVEGLRDTHEVELTIDGARAQVFTVAQPKGADHSAADQHLRARLAVKAGPHTVAAAFVKRPSLLMETSRQPYQAHFNMDRHPRIQPAIYSVTINGPYGATGAGETPSRKRIFACRDDTEACAQRIIGGIARRAYRRPVAAKDIEAPLRFYRQARAGADFETGIEMALRAVLVSPEFLFRIERDPPGARAPYRITDVELASRLSFFLWSSIPDDELLKAPLHLPASLERQTRRMLADPRSRTLASNFASQWLYLRNLASASPDMRLFPDFDDNLRRAFRRETELLFEDIQGRDRSVLELLSAGYTFLNERLAKHYGIPNVYGDRFRRVELNPGANRKGLLGHGSILTVTSYANRTSPVIRGKWVLDNLLGVPPPPPPAIVPALRENAAGRSLSMRERLSEHRDNAACAGCHKLMDPVGFALENYDAVGRWREVDETGRAIDAAGGLPDGSAFDGAAALQEALLRRPELFAGTFAEKLLTFATGRGVEASDAPAVRKVVRESAARNYEFSSFILGIVRSAPFQMRRPAIAAFDR